MTEKYQAKVLVWHSGDGCYYEAGGEITVAHLEDSVITLLLEKEIIAEIPAGEKREPTMEMEAEANDANGIDNTDD